MAGTALGLNTGIGVPAICCGGGARIKDGRVFEEALRTGYRFVDTAVRYGNDHLVFASEFGRRLVAEDRENVVVCTKLETWHPLPESLHWALERMGLEYLDLLLVHHLVHPKNDEPLKYLRQTWKAMEQFVDDGLVRMIGVSNAGPSLLQFVLDLCRIPPVVDQVEFHPYVQQRDLQAACDAAGIRLQAYCPLGSPWRQAKRGTEGPAEDPVVAEIAGAKGKSPAQVILRWMLEKGVIPVVSSTRPEHMRQNLDVFDFELEPSEREAIDALDQGGKARIWRDQVTLAGMFGTVTDGVLTIPKRWPG